MKESTRKMDGAIGLGNFISKVMDEFLSLKDNGLLSYFAIDPIDFEVSFTVEVDAHAGIKFHIIDVGAKVQAEHVHKAKIVLRPITTIALLQQIDRLQRTTLDTKRIAPDTHINKLSDAFVNTISQQSQQQLPLPQIAPAIAAAFPEMTPALIAALITQPQT